MSRDIREVIREEPLVRGRLVELLLRDGPLTVPEIARAGRSPRGRGDGLDHGAAQVRLRRRGEGARPATTTTAMRR